jgi:NarL family two-component system response regulator LiaR
MAKGDFIHNGTSRQRDNEAAIRILIVEDRLLVAESLQVTLSIQPDLNVIGIADSRTKALQLAATQSPDVALIGSGFLFDGSPPLAADLHATITLAVVIIASNGNHEALLSWVEGGCQGFVHTSWPLSEMVSVIRRTAAGEVAIPANVLYEAVRDGRKKAAERHADSAALSQLTPREREVLNLIARGLDNRTIAEHLGVSLATARGHVQNILEKLGVHSKLQAMRYVSQASPS